METERSDRLPVHISSAVFISDEQGRLLFLQQAAERKGHRWGPPAGGIHAHENPIMNVLREAKEEIGVDIELIDLVGIYTSDRGENETGIGFVFRGKITRGEININKEEIKDWKFFTTEELNELALQDLIYKPEYNIPAIKDWERSYSYSLEIIKSII